MTQKSNQKEIKMHKESYFMYEKTKKECFERMSEAMNPDGSKKWKQSDIDEKINLLEQMQDDVKQKFLIAGGDISELESNNRELTPLKAKKTIEKKNNSSSPLNTTKKRTPITRKKTEKDNPAIENTENKISNTSHVPNEIPIVPLNWNADDFSESFDVIPLPSRGECYENGMSTIAVSYLTANDENMIVSPNLYRDGLILDYLLKAKIKNTEINPDDLLEGDREAIILWLRATGYGTQYPITVTDNKTGVNFDTVVDLTQIKHKPFVLKGDGEGCFDFTLPASKDNVKFRFLTHGDIKQIEAIEKDEQGNVKRERLKSIVEDLNNFIENDNLLNKDEKSKIFEAKRNITKWAEKIEVDNFMGYTHTLTNRLELSIVSINGEDDREYISDYVQNMNVRDALALRRYISDNEPGLDYTVTVERPESLGGGSMPVFLSLDEYIFLNIT